MDNFFRGNESTISKYDSVRNFNANKLKEKTRQKLVVVNISSMYLGNMYSFNSKTISIKCLYIRTLVCEIF